MSHPIQFVSDHPQYFNVQAGSDALLAQVRLVVRTSRHEDLTVPIRSQASDSPQTIAFEEEEAGIEATLTLVPSGNAIVLQVSARLRNKNPFGPQHTFPAKRALTLRIGDMPGLTGLMASYRHKDWWTRPYTKTDLASVPPRTQSLLWQTADGYRFLLPVVDRVFKAELCGGPQGLELQLGAGQDGFTACDTVAFALTMGAEPFALPDAALEGARTQLPFLVKTRTERRYPELLEYLGWCSWDAFYQEVDEKGVLAKADELHRLGVPVKWFMIDDGWLDVEDGGIRSFDANKSKFPDGLAGASRQLKERFGVRQVGVWHTILGYWGGVKGNGALAAQVAPGLREGNNGTWVPEPDAARGFGFWNGWHGYLKRNGIDFVKVDGQSALANVLEGQLPIGRAAEQSHTALEAAVSLHFDGSIINCMGMAAENVWHRPTSAVSRSSDDFMPNEENGFSEHALQNTYNSFYHGAFYWGDWDMFWSDHRDDVASALLRAVSGGPVYVSDPLGRTNAAVLQPLALSDGRLLRCDRPGMPTADCLLRNPQEESIPLKVWNRAGGAGLLAAFHIQTGGGDLSGTVRPSDVPGLQGERFAVLDAFAGRVFVLGPDEPHAFTLAPRGYALYVIRPIVDGFAAFGLTGKYAGTLTVKDADGEESPGHRRLLLREGGEFAFYSEREPVSVTANGLPIAFAGDNGLYKADAPFTAGGVVTVELAFA